MGVQLHKALKKIGSDRKFGKASYHTQEVIVDPLLGRLGAHARKIARRSRIHYMG